MPTVIATLKVKDGKEKEAAELLKELATGVRANEPGTLAYVPLQRKDDSRSFVVYEKYESQEAFKTHSANLAKHGARFIEVLDGRPEVVFLEEV